MRRHTLRTSAVSGRLAEREDPQHFQAARKYTRMRSVASQSDVANLPKASPRRIKPSLFNLADRRQNPSPVSFGVQAASLLRGYKGR